jgi:hypothetical protein
VQVRIGIAGSSPPPLAVKLLSAHAIGVRVGHELPPELSVKSCATRHGRPDTAFVPVSVSP